MIDLISRPNSPNEHRPLPAIATATATTTTSITILPLPPQLQQSTTDSILIKRISELEQHMADLVSKAVDEIVKDAIDWAIQAPHRDRFIDLPEADMKEILHHRMWETNSYKAHEDHKKLYEALEKSMDRDHSDQLLTDLAKARRKKKKRHDSPKTQPRSLPHQPPPPPPPAGPSGTSEASETSGSSQLPPPPPPPSTNQSDQSKSTASPSSLKTAVSAKYTAWTTTDTRLKPSVSSIPEDLHMDDDTAPNEQVEALSEEDRPATPEPTWSIPSSDLPTGDMAIFMDWFYKKQGIMELTQKDLEGLAFEIVKVFHPNVIHLQYQMEECHKLLTDKVDDAIIRPALSISKMKAACYLDVSLEQMVPDQMWIKDECKYDIAAMYGISHWWFQRQRFYIDRHTSKGDRRATIVLRRADLNEYIIAERDFKYLYPSDFEDLYLLNLQGHLNHLPPKDKKILSTAVNLWIRNLVIRQRVEDFQLGIKSYQTQLNLTKPRWDATGFEFKHDFTIDEALDYRVKEFKVNRMNPVGFNPLVHSFRALSTLRRSGLRTASAAAKPCQGDSSEFYLITGSIYTDKRGTVVLATLFNESEQRHFRLFITNILAGISTVEAAGQRHVNSQPQAHTSYS
ncbi:hypothetical protein Tco_0704383 [Tanacetum coccineum]|uniref:Uncharacterized protein n=1 Tax=Tanacetum coccineum TaxID=301880 RepID=A0ABQ4Y2Z1_9ASTR